MRSPDTDKDLQRLLRKLGLHPGALYKIRFGGVVGKMALIAFAALMAIGAVAWRAPNAPILWGCLGTIVLVAFAGTAAIVYFGHKHPTEGTLEGSEVVAMQQLRNEFAAKGVIDIPEQPLVAQRVDTKALKPPTEGELT